MSKFGSKLLALGFGAAVALAMSTSGASAFGSFFHHQYAAKFICGAIFDEDVKHLDVGRYKTAINVHNPGRSVEFTIKLAASARRVGDGPDAETVPVLTEGLITGRLGLSLDEDRALEIDCQEDVAVALGLDGFGDFIKGFIVIESSKPLDVVAVYTSRANNGVGVCDAEVAVNCL